ncbi:MAG: tRNA uridine-5-carboxymethylaminomethyl(34) synthesis enzyme MnmG [Bacillota bacterium]
MRFVAGEYDLIVIGAGHAGCEAGLAAARLGASVLMLTINLDSVALLPCNPSIGGPAKGQIVREIDALGGEMGKVIDAACLQLRMLNTSKGPAVQTLRAQVDKHTYQQKMRAVLDQQPGLLLKQAMVEEILVEDGQVTGVATQTGAVYLAPTVVLTTGTYLRGRVIIGDVNYEGGPNGLQAARSLTENLQRLGITIGRFKTGTPPRVSRRTIDFSKLQEQPGDLGLAGFSGEKLPPELKSLSCWLTYTNERTHEIIRANLHRAPMFSGEIKGRGPRYCPSVEDKVVRFSDRPRHQIFVEPEGWGTDEMYVQGFSTSLPEDVQLEALRTVAGLERVEILRPGYAIEYDYVDPTQLKLSLEFQQISGLFAAGQINGSSGYEEAAGQGLIAGVNAVRKLRGQSPIILRRSQAYIGVLIDDLVTKGIDEPYRMMTSRAEYRLLLRHDNADVRLTRLGWEIGLVSHADYQRFVQQQDAVQELRSFLARTTIHPSAELDEGLQRLGSTPLSQPTSLQQLLKRPEVNLQFLQAFSADLARFPAEIWPRAEIEVKYEGYINKQKESVERFLRLEEKAIPSWLDFEQIAGLSLEARQKLTKLRPESIGQASRITGVSPADINVLLVAMEVMQRRGELNG